MRRMALLVVMVGSLSSCGDAAPDGEESGLTSGPSIPEELALALIVRDAAESRLHVGMPEDDAVPSALLDVELPILGTLSREDGGTVVYEVPGSTEDAFGEVERALESDGWWKSGAWGPTRGGFVSTARTFGGVWCRDAEWLRATRVLLESGTWVRVVFHAIDPVLSSTPCEDAERSALTGRGYERLSFPELVGPSGADVRSTGGSGSSNYGDTNAYVTTDLTPEELFDHYARQLTREGWKPEAETKDRTIALGYWMTEDESGVPLQGALMVWPSQTEGTHRAWLRLDRPEMR